MRQTICDVRTFSKIGSVWAKRVRCTSAVKRQRKQTYTAVIS